MDLSTSLNTKPTIDLIDYRSTLYYGKYNYRARLRLNGIRRTSFAKDIEDYKKKLHGSNFKIDISAIDLMGIEKYLIWRDTYATGKNKQVTIRIEGETAGIFSNDLQLLKTLDNIGTVDYTEIDNSIPTGVKYFTNDPKYNYRIYLKSKKVDEKFKEDLKRFIDRYKDSNTVIVPSNALNDWLSGNKRKYYWFGSYCSSHYFIDYNDDSTNSLIGIMFGNMIKSRFKLEKRPEQ
jgi:hypothetical protein